jgi:serine/threonine-protein kinase
MAMHLRATPPPPRELWPDIPAELEGLLLAMLAKQPDQRPTTMEVVRRLEAVRGELERRCQVRNRPRLPAAAPEAPPAARRQPSRPGRLISSGLAPTEPFAWRSETRRWQYAIGGLALALSGLMFLISRAGDRAASAATAPEAITEASTEASPARAAAAELQPRRIAPRTAEGPPAEGLIEAAAPAAPGLGAPLRTAAARAGEVVLRTAVVVEPVAPAPAALHRDRAERPPAVPHDPDPARVVTRPASPRSPAAPRLRAKVDPDGTLDVYR